ncbi:MAG TPA: methyltransferase [Syntrophobacteraceae bacterium]|nr:methyltransferase [Syntrophobacteraceae bacterium]
MDKLLPDLLKQLWQSVEQKLISRDEFSREQERLLLEYRNLWEQALILDGRKDLQESLCSELALYSGCEDLSEVRSRCSYALSHVKDEWLDSVERDDHRSVERFYNESEAMIYELMWWHSLCDDSSPLAYVAALHFAGLHGCKSYLDFGAGVGSGGILFARNGLEVTLADISSSMLNFSRWRFDLRGITAQYVDLKERKLHRNAYDIVAAMDVFEHLVDPVQTVDEIWEGLVPGGFLFGRFHSELDADRPHHIVQDFGPTLDRLRELGFVMVWQDEWLWGHQIFQKS